MHREISIQAELAGASLNQWVSDAIESALQKRLDQTELMENLS